MHLGREAGIEGEEKERWGESEEKERWGEREHAQGNMLVSRIDKIIGLFCKRAP